MHLKWQRHMKLLRNTLIIFFLLAPTFALGTPLLSHTAGNAQISLDSQDDGSGELLFTVRNITLTKANAFHLKNPKRIVLDIVTDDITRGAKVLAYDNPVVAGMRIGIHPDKVRIVLDIKASAELRYKWSSSGTGLYVSIAGSGGTVQPPRPAPTPTLAAEPMEIVEPTTQPKAEVIIKTDPVIEPEPAPTQALIIPEPEPVEIEDEPYTGSLETIDESDVEPSIPIDEIDTVSKEKRIQLLRNIRFAVKKDSGDPTLRLILNNRPEFQVEKKSERKYVISLPGSDLQSAVLELVRYPPQDFIGMLSVKATLTETGVDIGIAVDPGYRVEAVTKGQEIWVQVVS